MRVFAIFLMILSSVVLVQAQQQKEPLAMISTEYGDIIVKLYNDTPKHRDNFLKLVKEGHYDGTTFHRVIIDFMIQAGGRVDYTLPAEIKNHYHHKKGALAAARRPDQVNPQKRSSGSQFYIVEGKVFTPKQLMQMQKATGKKFTRQMIEDYTSIGGAPHLDREYTVFGEVVMGLGVVEKISKVKTNNRDKPYQSIPITVKILD